MNFKTDQISMLMDKLKVKLGSNDKDKEGKPLLKVGSIFGLKRIPSVKMHYGFVLRPSCVHGFLLMTTCSR